MTPEEQILAAREMLVAATIQHNSERIDAADSAFDEGLARLVAERDEARRVCDEYARHTADHHTARVRAERERDEAVSGAQVAALREALDYIANGVDNPRAVAHAALAGVPAADPPPPEGASGEEPPDAEACGACGSRHDVKQRGWTDDSSPMPTCAACGAPASPASDTEGTVE